MNVCNLVLLSTPFSCILLHTHIAVASERVRLIQSDETGCKFGDIVSQIAYLRSTDYNNFPRQLEWETIRM